MTRPAMRPLLLCGFLCWGLSACGVKHPPIAPERPRGPTPALNVDCSPEEEDCDRTDPNYRPRKR